MEERIVADEIREPTEGDRKAFLEKLGQFRCTLAPNEQRMLDSMAIAAMQPVDKGDVSGYGFAPVYAPVTVATPQVYVNAFGGAYVGTQWQTVAVQTGWAFNPFIP
jgi:hypothetical protein